MHKVWITAGADNTFSAWVLSGVDKVGGVTKTASFIAHTMKITDINEIDSPKCIVSCSLDGKIKLWDYQNHSFVSEVKEPSIASRGIRGLTYSSE